MAACTGYEETYDRIGHEARAGDAVRRERDGRLHRTVLLLEPFEHLVHALLTLQTEMSDLRYGRDGRGARTETLKNHIGAHRKRTIPMKTAKLMPRACQMRFDSARKTSTFVPLVFSGSTFSAT